MGQNSTSFLNRLSHQRALTRWARLARLAKGAERGELEVLAKDARALRHTLEDFLTEAEMRLDSAEASFPEFPLGTDWHWRPDLWALAQRSTSLVAPENGAGFGKSLKIFHDASRSEITLRQLRNRGRAARAPFGLRLDVLGFDGGFLSCVIDLPKQACDGLRLVHLVRLDMLVECERRVELFARINVKHGPNVEQVVTEVSLEPGEARRAVEFDLAWSKLNEKRVESAWIDLIFGEARMNQIVIRDLVLSRHPRAEL